MAVKKKTRLALTSLLFRNSSSSCAAAGLPCACSYCSSTFPCSMSSAASFLSSAWQWPSCKQPRTHSFRHPHHHQQQTMMKTMNSAYSADSACFSANSFASLDSFSSSTCVTACEVSAGPAAVEAEADAVVCALRSDRLFFDPDVSPVAATSVLINKAATKKKKKKKVEVKEFDGVTAMSIESSNPYGDFRASMEAMVARHGSGAKDWRWLEEMLGWYLRVNAKSTHGLVVRAFVDLLVAASSASPS
ncbi:hypothetical protein GUJ93_ZPchr0010g8040 [Zizania palustris]|uniref:Transcription repressor n=1 Tax=Zizania palustris TaxID=103762 RepID=A0A8J6BG51_ZIZPA|nr:hypothetical protein GUJ93_ZPchr0010g8040 [Zizania palustris]